MMLREYFWKGHRYIKATDNSTNYISYSYEWNHKTYFFDDLEELHDFILKNNNWG